MNERFDNFIRYLSSKRSIEDRCLNRHVQATLEDMMSKHVGLAPVQVLEIGAGIGTMIERTLEWGLLTNAYYEALDSEPINVAEIPRRLDGWCASTGWTTRGHDTGPLTLSHHDRQVTVQPVCQELFGFLSDQEGSRSRDLIIASAFLDLVDARSTLPGLFSMLRPGGIFYFTINFDGVTIFEPIMDPDLDERIVRLYHRTMDQRLIHGKPSGHSRTGRKLLRWIPDAGGDLIAAGSSDWVVFARDGRYPNDEAYFLHFIVDTVGAALKGHPELGAGDLDEWVRLRHAQIEAGQLIYIAHQADLVGRLPA